MYKSKAPFRIGLAGGGTDVSPYSERYGGAVLNATVSLYAETSIEERYDKKIILAEGEREVILEEEGELHYSGDLDFPKAVYNVIQRKYPFEHKGFNLRLSAAVPTGSGLGTSSTMVVSILGAFLKWQKIELDNYEIAALAYHIEREELGMAGGKQDQYAAVFGGFNFIQFGDKVSVEPLKLDASLVDEINSNLILYFTRTNRESHNIILEQIENVEQNESDSLAAMHELKVRATELKEALESGKASELGHILSDSWNSKKRMAAGISNSIIDEIYNKAIEMGAIGGKISGAGGGGFMIFYADHDRREELIECLNSFDGDIMDYTFAFDGMQAWSE